MKTKRKARSVTVMMPPEMANGVKQEAASHGLTVSELLRILIWNDYQENAAKSE